MKKRVALIGSTGSIGTQCLDVILAHSDKFEVVLLCTHSNSDLLYSQSLLFKPAQVVLLNTEKAKEIHDPLFNKGIKLYIGMDSLLDLLSSENIDIVVNAFVGAAGTRATLRALGKQ